MVLKAVCFLSRPAHYLISFQTLGLCQMQKRAAIALNLVLLLIVTFIL